jgi:tetratricopeptide (TPR) repeat protein
MLSFLSPALTNCGHAGCLSHVGTEGEGLAGQASALKELGTSYEILDNYQDSEKCLDQSLALYSGLKEPRPKEVAEAKQVLGSLYRIWGKYDLALPYLQKARQTLVALGNKSAAAFAGFSLGATLFEMGNQAAAFQQYTLSLKESQEIDYKEGEAAVLGRLAEWYVGRHLCDEGVKYAKQALAVAEETNASGEGLNASRFMARAYLCAGSLQQAKAEAQHASDVATQLKDRYASAYNFETLAMVAEAQGDVPGAVANGEKSVALWNSIHSLSVDARSARANLARWKSMATR